MQHTSETPHVILETLCNGGGRKSLNPKLLSRLRLESLDGRIVPDAMPIMDPAMMLTTQTSPDTPVAIPTPPQATIAPVTDVAVVPLTDDAGNVTDVYMILERAGNEYIVTYYDAIENQLYASTDSPSLYTPANAQLDAMMLQYGTPGDINTLFMATAEPAVVAPLADPQATGPAVTPAQTPVPVIVLPSARAPAQPPVNVLPNARPPAQPGIEIPILPQNANPPPFYANRPEVGPGAVKWRPIIIYRDADGTLLITGIAAYIYDPNFVPPPIIQLRPAPIPGEIQVPKYVGPPTITPTTPVAPSPKSDVIPPDRRGMQGFPNVFGPPKRVRDPNNPFGPGSIIGPSTPTPDTPPLTPGIPPVVPPPPSPMNS